MCNARVVSCLSSLFRLAKFSSDESATLASSWFGFYSDCLNCPLDLLKESSSSDVSDPTADWEN